MKIIIDISFPTFHLLLQGHNVVVFTEDGVFVRRIGCENITNFPNGIDISGELQKSFKTGRKVESLCFPADAGDILIGDSHGNRFHVAVFANDGNLLAEFECPHVKVIFLTVSCFLNPLIFFFDLVNHR